MKKLFGLALAFVAVLALSGCSGLDDASDNSVVNSIYMSQENNHEGYKQKIYYHCFNSAKSGIITNENPDFTRDIDDTCDFDLHGRPEITPDNNVIGNNYVEGRIYLTDSNDNPWDGQDYSCEKPYGNDTVHYRTGPNGYIDQASNYYRCTIYFQD